jgi:hypothetical protein
MTFESTESRLKTRKWMLDNYEDILMPQIIYYRDNKEAFKDNYPPEVLLDVDDNDVTVEVQWDNEVAR